MGKRRSVFKKAFEYNGKKIIIETDSQEYLEEEGRKYETNRGSKEDHRPTEEKG